MAADVVLIIPDRTVAKYLATVLARHGLACHQAATVAQAVALLRAGGQWAAIVVDCDLMTRRHLADLRELKKAHPTIPLLALDSLATRHTCDQPDPLFDALVPKPFVLKPLLAALKRLTPGQANAASS